MNDTGTPRWLTWAREIQALSQSGLMYSQSEFDTERYHRLTAIAAEIVAEHSTLETRALAASFYEQAGYATPKVDVRAAVLEEEQVLLVQERSDGQWALPGGWADVGEPPSEAVEREVREETGLEVKARKIIAVFDANRDVGPLALYHAYRIVFLCELVGGQISSSHETLTAAYFPFDGLPPLSRNRTSERYLAEVRAHVRNNHRPAVFD